MEKIYLDNAATTNLSAEVLNEMLPVLTNEFGNSSSIHSFGRNASSLVDNARDIIAETINAKSNEIYFTASGSEANSWALVGIANANRSKGNHIIVSSIEHPSIMNVMKELELKGYDVVYLSVNEEGVIDFEELEEALKIPSVLVTVMHVNNEVVSINDINRIEKLGHKYNTIFHSDITQSIGKIDVPLRNVDLASFSSHKLFAPKGAGVLVKKNNIKLTPLFYGGGQEFNYRSGTSNWPTNISMARALRLMLNYKNRNYDHVLKLWNILYEELKDIDVIHINSKKGHSPYIFNFSISTLTSEVLVHSLEEKGFCVSTVSACGSKISHGSYVIKSMYQNDKYASSSVRVSLAYEVEEYDIIQFIKALKEIIGK